MSLPINDECILCQLNRNTALARKFGEKAATDTLREMMRLYLDADPADSSPVVAARIDKMLQQRLGIEEDSYAQDKAAANRFVLERMDTLRQAAQIAPDPVYAGLQLAILGNYLDFSGLKGQVSFDKLDEMIASAMEMELDRDCYRNLCEDLDKAKNLLFVTDNAGEIGFDRVLAEQIEKKYPHLAITFLVRGGIAANDATREDAMEMGIPYPIIDNGNRLAGTDLRIMSKKARAVWDSADVILSKGLGNIETLYGCGYNIYYAFLVKCQRFVSLFQKPLMTPMLVKER